MTELHSMFIREQETVLLVLAFLMLRWWILEGGVMVVRSCTVCLCLVINKLSQHFTFRSLWYSPVAERTVWMASFSLVSEGVTKTKGRAQLMIPTEKKSEEFLTPNSYIGQQTVSQLHTWLWLGNVPVDIQQPRDKRGPDQWTSPTLSRPHHSRHLRWDNITRRNKYTTTQLAGASK